jgi:hypothetical protein
MRFRTETKKGGFREPWEHTQSFPFGPGLGSHDLSTGEREDKPCLVLSNGERGGPLLAAQVGGCERFCRRHQRVKTDKTRRDAVVVSGAACGVPHAHDKRLTGVFLTTLHSDMQRRLLSVGCRRRVPVNVRFDHWLPSSGLLAQPCFTKGVPEL